jgi:GT2 family glycosyltransferase
MADPIPHYFHSVPGWFDWPDLYEQLVAGLPSGSHVVEVGAWKGQSAAFMGVEIANSGKDLRYDVVDTWEGSPDEPDHLADPDVQNGRLYDVFLANTAPVRQYVRPIRSTSVEAASSYPDASLDVVFIDGDHTTDAVVADLQAWWPKVKPGGVLLGHDRDWPSVQLAVHAFVQFSGVRVRPAGLRCFEFHKPEQVTDWTVPEAERAVLIAICSNERSIYRQTAKSLLDCLAGPDAYDDVAKHGFAQNYQIKWFDQYPSVAAMRDHAMMEAQLMQASHVLFLDADMTWPRNVLDLMLRHHSAGMVSGVYHLKSWPYWPVILERPFINNETRKRKLDDGTTEDMPPSYAVEYHYCEGVSDPDSPVQACDLIGMGCALVPVKLTQAFTRPWFEYMPDSRGLPAVTEDVAFCARARSVGCPILVDPAVQCGHIGQQEIKPAWYKRGMLERELLDKMKKAKQSIAGFDDLFGQEAIDAEFGRVDGSAA